MSRYTYADRNERNAARLRRHGLFAFCDLLRGLEQSASKELYRLTPSDLYALDACLTDYRALVRDVMVDTALISRLPLVGA